MKTYHFFISLFLLIFLVSCTKSIDDFNTTNEPIYATERSEVIPELVMPWHSGDAAYECSQAGSSCDFAWKVDDSAPNGEFHTNTDMYGNTPTDFDATIVIYNSNGSSFSWTSDYVVCAVIVKGGQGAHIYRYEDGSCGDTELTAPINPANGQLFDVSHISFCFSNTSCGGSSETCYEEETAWAYGERYTIRGNWATYVTYDLELEDEDYPTLEVALKAGRRHNAGTVTLSSTDGITVDIVIAMNDGWIFYYDVNDSEEDDNVKIQDYAEAPSGNPAPGLFDWKETAEAGSTSYTISVPYNSYYGIHIDVAKEVECED